MTFTEKYKDFLPETPMPGKRGFYPAMTKEEYRALPLPMRCATWDANIEEVIFDVFFADYGAPARVAVHPEYAFKCLFRHSETDTQLYSVCAVRTKDGKKRFAEWNQDTTSGAFAITDGSGHIVGKMGGFRAHVPANCHKTKSGEWVLDCSTPGNNETVTRACLS